MRNAGQTAPPQSLHATTPRAAGAATGTINRETSALHRMGTLAVHWGWLDTVPGFPDRLRENPPRQGFFEHPEYLAVRAHLNSVGLLQQTVHCDRLSASYLNSFGLHQNVSYLSGVVRHSRTPLPKSAMRVRGLGPFVEIPALDLVLLRVLPLRFQYQYVTVL